MADGDVLEQTKRKLTNLLKQPGWEVIRWDAFVPQWQAQCDAAGVAMREDLSELNDFVESIDELFKHKEAELLEV